MLNWSHVAAQQERYQDLRDEAEQDGLFEQVRAGHAMRDRFHRQALTWLGDRLVAWGWRLQERYGASAVAICSSACKPYLASR
jgi:hypothetical protein